jgi:hypothetical protein
VSVVHVPWGIAPSERQYRADNAPRPIVMDNRGGEMEQVTWYVGIDWGRVCQVVEKSERVIIQPLIAI